MPAAYVSFISLVFVLLQGLKKPYNPILGEVFRCYWRHEKTDSRTFYISEQVANTRHIVSIIV